MKSMTYPSRIATILDLPEPTSFDVSYQYNFFTPDEEINGTASGYRASTAESIELLNLKIFNASTPRYARISWTPTPIVSINPRSKKESLGITPAGAERVNSERIFNAANAGKIQSEQSFSNFEFVAMNFNDTMIDEKLFAIVSGSTDLRNIKDGHLRDAAKTLNERTNENINGNFLSKALSRQGGQGIVHIASNKKAIQVKKINNLSMNVQFNNKIVGTAIRNASEDGLNLFAEEMSKNIEKCDNIQTDAIQKNNPRSTSSEKWDTGFYPVLTVPMNPVEVSSNVTDIKGAGYIIEKSELDRRGKTISTRHILVEGQTGSSLIDAAIKHNTIYKYRIASVAIITLPGEDENGNLSKMIGLMRSKYTNPIRVICKETTPPAFPADFRLVWDYSTNNLKLLWSFPLEPQRDIKYFQIFRRKSLDKPFELIRMFDFNDSMTPNFPNEQIRSDIITKLSEPITFFTDTEFTKESSYIYALCCIDAHQMTSNYTAQFSAEFDKFRNKLNVKMLSRANAPKAYPNLFLPESVTTDVMKTSGFKRLTICFDPECISAIKSVDGHKVDVNFLPVLNKIQNDQSSEYKLQLINTDLQDSEVITIKINDKRRNTAAEALGARDLTETDVVVATVDLLTL